MFATDKRLASAIGVAVFLLAAWPLVAMPVPPYQDLPGHMATAHVVANLDRYPEFVFNGFLKTNGALIAWMYFVGKLVGIVVAAKLFALATLFVTALALPHFVLEMTDRRRLIVATPFLGPMVHNWYVAMGMLNFALAFALALVFIVLLRRQREAPTIARGALAAVLGLAIWFAHSFAFLVVGLLVLVHLAIGDRSRDRLVDAKRIVPPVLPAAALVGWGVLRHLTDVGGSGSGAEGIVVFESVPWLVYNLWAHFTYGFTPLSATSLVLAVVLAFVAARRWRTSPAFFSPFAAGALLVLYAVCPYMMPGFGYMASRFVPFVWMAALVRVPDRLPRSVTLVAVMCCAAYFVGHAVDMFRLSADLAAYTAGTSAVRPGARMLSLNFRPRVTSKNTWSLALAWGIYVIERQTSVATIWADTHALPITYSHPPNPRVAPAQLAHFMDATRTRAEFCASMKRSGLDPAHCEDEWRAQWSSFWRDVEPEFDHVLLWGAPADVRDALPQRYRPVHESGDLLIVAR